MQTFSEEREKVDNIIDNYFRGIVEPDVGKVDSLDESTYRAWLLLFDREDDRESKKEFLKFMQHEMQHEIKKSLIK